jgi:hypothetical protein
MQVISTVPGLSKIDESLPKPAIKYIPDWWRQTPHVPQDVFASNPFGGNVKNCPSFPDYFSQGIIIPMWVDSVISYDEETEEWGWKTSNANFSWGFHPKEQYSKYVDHVYLGDRPKAVFKANSPWRIITKKGYSVLQLPVFYHFNKDFTVLPGVVDTDMAHQINPTVLFMSDKKDIFIPRGTPLVQYIPFKREDLSLEVRDSTEQDNILFSQLQLESSVQFPGSKFYINKRKKWRAK